MATIIRDNRTGEIEICHNERYAMERATRGTGDYNRSVFGDGFTTNNRAGMNYNSNDCGSGGNDINWY